MDLDGIIDKYSSLWTWEEYQVDPLDPLMCILKFIQFLWEQHGINILDGTWEKWTASNTMRHVTVPYIAEFYSPLYSNHKTEISPAFREEHVGLDLVIAPCKTLRWSIYLGIGFKSKVIVYNRPYFAAKRLSDEWEWHKQYE